MVKNTEAQMPPKPITPFRYLTKVDQTRIPDPKWYNLYNTKYFQNETKTLQFYNEETKQYEDVPSEVSYNYIRFKKD